MTNTKKQKPVPDVVKMFKLAEHYREASRLLEDQARCEEWGCSGPKIAVDSFAVELYLKCLYVQDHNKRPPGGKDGHDVVLLFEALESSTRDFIVEEFNRIIREDTVLRNLRWINPEAVKTADFRRTLDAARDTFAGRRYLYEELEPEREWFHAHILGNALRTIVKRDLRIAKLG